MGLGALKIDEIDMTKQMTFQTPNSRATFKEAKLQKKDVYNTSISSAVITVRQNVIEKSSTKHPLHPLFQKIKKGGGFVLREHNIGLCRIT